MLMNKIISLHNANGEKLEEHGDIEKELIAYYHQLLSKMEIDRKSYELNLEPYPQTGYSRVECESNEKITPEEMEGTIMEMATGKSPRKDGFTTEFFQNCCTVVETNVWKVIEDSRSTQGILQAFNSTFLSLIPKEG